MIKVKNLGKSFRNNKVLNDLGFEIGENEIVGLLGPNGAGKTTTIRILTGFLPFEVGQVEILNKNIANTCDALKIKQKIGYLPENNPLYPEMLVYEYLYMISELKQIDKKDIHKEIKRVVEKTGIKSVYYRPISDLSKGFKQRVGLAVSILGDPQILILDEPTEGLDPNQRVDIRNLIKEFGKNKTVIISSHVLSEVENTCDRIIIINNGIIVKDDKTENILNSNQKKLILKLEGQNILEKIKQLTTSVNLVNQVNLVAELEINTDSIKNIIPQISKLICENNWIVWEMKVQESKLEDVFRELTQ
ncbi:MAG: ATP-binding cassette domain-containing protein [Patescibacteria group bacterium]